MRIAVTGACGLLGTAVIERAQQRNHRVVAVDKDPAVRGLLHVSTHQVDICDRTALSAALHDVDAVVHTASLVDLHLGRPQRLLDVNVHGAQNVVAACRSAGVPALVHMSSAEVIAGDEPLRGATESQLYPSEHLTYYGETKQRGEQAVLGAADGSLGTCAMRSFGIFGEGDNTVVPSYLSRLVGNRVAQVGDGAGRTDTVYAPNLAHALLLAAEQLAPDAPWSGSAFHVTDHEPVNMQVFLRQVTEPLGIDFIDRFVVPRRAVDLAASIYELRYRAMPHERFAYPRLTRHSTKLAFDDYWLDRSKLAETLGYEPVVTRDQAVSRTQTWIADTFAAS